MNKYEMTRCIRIVPFKKVQAAGIQIKVITGEPVPIIMVSDETMEKIDYHIKRETCGRTSALSFPSRIIVPATYRTVHSDARLCGR